MKEIQEKLKELNIKLGEVKSKLDQSKERQKRYRDVKDAIAWELEYDLQVELNEMKKKIEKQVDILSKADMIMLNVDGWED